MSMLRSHAFDMMRRVRDEYEGAKFSLAETVRLLDSNPGVFRASAPVTRGQLIQCRANLEITYIVWLFSAFEGILRDFWRDGRLTFGDCKSHLGRFLGWLSPEW